MVMIKKGSRITSVMGFLFLIALSLKLQISSSERTKCFSFHTSPKKLILSLFKDTFLKFIIKQK
jgi:hypothetical protein